MNDFTKEYYESIYANRNGRFLIIKSYCGLISPAKMKCSIPEHGECILYYLGCPEDLFMRIITQNKYSQIELCEYFGVSQQHISRLFNGTMQFKWDLDRLQLLINLFFKHFHLKWE